MAIIPVDEKVFMVSNNTNTTYGGSAALQAMNQWYTMQDVIDTVGGGASYRVYTALLTQNGTAAPVATVLENTIGVMGLFYSYPGNYSITSVEFNGYADYGKVAILFTNGGGGYFTNTQYVPPINGITIRTSNNLATDANNLMQNATIEIRLYN
jgi:hypothetical protein